LLSAADGLIGGRPVDCDQRDMDRYGRIVAVCTADCLHMSGWMVAQGWALAYGQNSADYVGQEATAQAASLGIWQARFVPRWDWRRGERLASEPANDNAPGQCLINGNISSSGERIYHVPGGPYYDKTGIDPAKGE
jgi:hypothetical protein